MEIKNSLNGFICHNVNFNKVNGTQAIGDCIFCGKEDHFFANMENRLWDCKRCGAKGNFNQFLEMVSQHNIKNLKDKEFNAIAIDRKLPKAAFAKWELGWNGKEYTLPVRSAKGAVVDLRRWQIGKKTMATSGATLGLLGEHKLAQMIGKDVYICEGEWDTIALAWLFKKLDTDSVAVGVPGASVFKNEWTELFVGRNVFLLHDNDVAGEAGRRLCYEKLNGIAKDIKVISWPNSLPEGFDIRDFITNEAIVKQKPRSAWSKLRALFTVPQAAIPSTIAPTPALQASLPPGPPISSQKVLKAYQKWLHIPSDECLRVMFGAAFANKIQGDPLWLFMIAPPGGSKSELLMSLSGHPIIETTTSLTPQTLVSGATGHGGSDPSLLPKLNGKILVVKDFTTILTMHYTSRDEIFGVLRDCYDGKTEKIFGTGMKRSYNVHFGILAGVTPKIEEFGIIHQSLGERFLKYRINTGEKSFTETDRIRRALMNINKEKQMREDLCEVAHKVLSMGVPEKLPEIPQEIFERIINLAQACAMMRGVVERDRFSQRVMYKPTTEVGTRLAKQLAKLGIGIAIYLGRDSVDLEIYDLIKKVALDTVPDRVEEIIKRLWESCPNPEDILKTSEVSIRTRLPVATCFGVLQDLELLRLVERVGSGNKYEWKLGKVINKLILQAFAYPLPKKPEQPIVKPLEAAGEPLPYRP